MSLPLEGSRDVHEGIIISMIPDICLTPAGSGMVPIPYTIWCLQADAANLANTVRQTDDRSHAVASIVQRCYGDEPGTGGGIYSGTTGAECTPKTWSATVRAEGRNMVRHLDQWWMNHRNTYGQLLYTKDLSQYNIPEPEQITPQMRTQTSTASSATVKLPQVTQLAQASIGLPMEGPMGPPLGPAQMEQLQNVGKALQQGYNEQFGPGTMPLAQRPAENIRRYREALEAFIASRLRVAQKNCPQQTFCFPGPKDPTKLPEYEKQLEMQNSKLNTLNPCHYLLNRARYQVLRSNQMQNLSSNSRKQAREDFFNGGGTGSNLAALHCLDMVAGGDPTEMCGLGDSNVNSLIGRHWQDVVPSMDRYARTLCQQGCPNMRAVLEVCGAPTS